MDKFKYSDADADKTILSDVKVDAILKSCRWRKWDEPKGRLVLVRIAREASTTQIHPPRTISVGKHCMNVPIPGSKIARERHAPTSPFSC